MFAFVNAGIYRADGSGRTWENGGLSEPILDYLEPIAKPEVSET
jgi:hypothetical protein